MTKLVKVDDPSVKSCELAFVTAINLVESTFYAQLCKFSNQELVEFNATIHNYCDKINENQTKSSRPPSDVKEGQVICTRYAADNNWYRAIVRTSNRAKQQCEVYFIDYGNIEVVNFDNLVVVDEKSLPLISHKPFGIICTAQELGKLDGTTGMIFLNCLMEEYIMINTSDRIDWHHWTVSLPRGAYNSAFWLNFEKKKISDQIRLHEGKRVQGKE